MTKTDEDSGELLSFAELSVALKRKGILNRSESTLRKYATLGARIPGQEKRTYLRFVYLSGVRRTSLRWFRDFLSEQNPNDG